MDLHWLHWHKLGTYCTPSSSTGQMKRLQRSGPKSVPRCLLTVELDSEALTDLVLKSNPYGVLLTLTQVSFASYAFSIQTPEPTVQYLCNPNTSSFDQHQLLVTSEMMCQ